MQYDKLLQNAYDNIKVVETNCERFECPKVKGFVSGKCTIITNFKDVASCLRRTPEQIAKFLFKELATSGKMDNGRLVLHCRLNSARVNDKIELFVKTFVLCNECKKPDTEIASENGVSYKHCLACNAKYPIKSGF